MPPGKGVDARGYYSPSGGSSIPYEGVVQGLVQLGLSKEVIILGEVEVLNVTDPIVLIGANAMTTPLLLSHPS